MLYKGVVFRLDPDFPADARFLLNDFRLAVNGAIRAGFQARVTSRNALAKLAHRETREEHPKMYAKHIVSALGVATGILRNHRWLVRKGVAHNIPYVRRLMMRAGNQAYELDRENGVIDLPIRAGCHVKLNLVVSQYHRKYLDDTTLTLGSPTVLPDRVIIAFRKEAPNSYVPESAVSRVSAAGTSTGTSMPA